MISQNWYIDIVRKVFLKDVNLEDIHILGDHRFVYIANKERSHKGIWWDFYWAIEHSNSRGPYIMYTCNLLRGDLRQIENRWSGFDNLDVVYICIYNFKKKESEWDVVLEDR